MSEHSISRGRRYISQAEKVRIVSESHTSGLNTAEIARINIVGLSSLIKWRKKTDIGVCLAKCKKFSRRLICSALEISSANLNRRLSEDFKMSKKITDLALSDEDVLVYIKGINRETYLWLSKG